VSPSIASVSSSGLVTAVTAGSATIRATVETKIGDGALTVTAPVTATTATVVATVDSSTLAPGHSAQGHAVAKDAQGNVLTGKTVSWSSNNVAIATVSATTGLVTAVSAGSALVQATVDGVAGQASVNVTVPSIITAPAPTSGTLVTHDFEDGTLGPYFNPWHSGIDVVSDPTSTGHGKVARVHYVADGVTQVDDNVGVFPTQTFSVGLGDSVWFRGDFYIANTADGMRKLVYWGWDGYEPEHFSMVLELEPGTGPASTQLQVISVVAGPSNLPKDATYTGKFITTKQWHRLEIQLKVNSSFAAKDGILRVWLDGAILYDRTNMQWTDPLWTSDPGLYKWASWGVGYQMQIGTGVGFDEYRYWDNVAFAKTRLP
jgi:hypothetical protein